MDAKLKQLMDEADALYKQAAQVARDNPALAANYRRQAEAKFNQAYQLTGMEPVELEAVEP